jgi:Tol biopolymer transport system component
MPDNKRIIFASNHEYKRGFPFNLYTINEDGTDLKKISHDNGFDAFPMFSPDGKKINFLQQQEQRRHKRYQCFYC